MAFNPRKLDAILQQAAALYEAGQSGQARQLAADSSLGQPPFVRFEVADAGPGVPEADREAIFEWFSRGSQPLGEGTGLGLAIARRIVRSHGGRLWTQPTEPPPPDSQGATFVFTLPVAHPGDRPDV